MSTPRAHLPEGYPSDFNPVNRLYGLGGSVLHIAGLLDSTDDPMATMMRLIGEDLENTAAWLDEYMQLGGAPDTQAE